jgi:hypothetical protein
MIKEQVYSIASNYPHNYYRILAIFPETDSRAEAQERHNEA